MLTFSFALADITMNKWNCISNTVISTQCCTANNEVFYIHGIFSHSFLFTMQITFLVCSMCNTFVGIFLSIDDNTMFRCSYFASFHPISLFNILQTVMHKCSLIIGVFHFWKKNSISSKCIKYHSNFKSDDVFFLFIPISINYVSRFLSNRMNIWDMLLMHISNRMELFEYVFELI